jgi:hypothetical protein
VKTLHQSAIDYLHTKFKNEIFMLTQGGAGERAQDLYKLFAARFGGQPYVLLQQKTELEFTEAMAAGSVEEEQFIQDTLFDYSTNLQIHLDQLQENGYEELKYIIGESVRRYMKSENIPETIKERVDVDYLDNPIIFLSYLMYTVVRRFNMEEAIPNESPAKSPRRS